MCLTDIFDEISCLLEHSKMSFFSNDTFPLVDLIEESSGVSDETLPMFSTPLPPPISGQYNFDYVEYLADLTDVQTSWSEDRAFLPATTVYSLTFVLGILGNGFVILALLSGWRVGRTNEGLSCIVMYRVIQSKLPNIESRYLRNA